MTFFSEADWHDVPRYFSLEDYEGGTARWCPGCGDHGVLSAVQRICREEQVPPERTVVVSGIGCSSRFPHYMGTYGFHGLHGRALPVACGVKARRPDLSVWVATGDGDCCSIGAAHWIHAVRYNMDLTVMMFDNAIYGLTKAQTSPTSPIGLWTNTHPGGAVLPPLDPLAVTLGITNVSFVAQTVDWSHAHLHATLQAAHRHPGLSFVRILQRCPQYTPELYRELQRDPSRVTLLVHAEGIQSDDRTLRLFSNQRTHDPRNLAAARALVEEPDLHPIGLLYRDESRPRYDELTRSGLDLTLDARIEAIECELDRFAVTPNPDRSSP